MEEQGREYLTGMDRIDRIEREQEPEGGSRENKTEYPISNTEYPMSKLRTQYPSRFAGSRRAGEYPTDEGKA